MAIGNAINGRIFTYISPVINFKNTGATTLFTTLSGQSFIPISYTYLCDSVITPGNDSQISIGWTGAAYDDFESSLSFAFNTLANGSWSNQVTNPGVGYLSFPASTAIRVNVSVADSGSVLSGRIIFNGYYI